jgi:hypothetical protein
LESGALRVILNILEFALEQKRNTIESLLPRKGSKLLSILKEVATLIDAQAVHL